MKTLVTGCAGFIGSHLCDRLLADGHEVIGMDNFIGGSLSNVPKGVDLWSVDCAAFFSCSSAFEGVELVYHCAASPHEGLSVFSPVVVARNTYLSTLATAVAAVNAGVKRFVFLSSMSRYGAGFVPFDECQRCAPVDPYGIAKVAAEDTLRILGREHGMEVVILVPHSVIGPRQKREDPFRNVAAIMMNLMLQGRQPFIYGDGQQKRCFSFISDAMDSIIKAGTQSGLDGEVINIGPDEEFVSINELARLIANILDFDLDPVYVPDRPCEVKLAYCSSDKARRLLGYETRVSLYQGLKEMADWMRSVGPVPFVYHLPIEIPGSHRLPRTWKERLI